ncbi:sugar kinase [Streptomyces sp. NPDC051738]|uniref:sugar kinase n=1 Tax=Streptomyces sp. NPDC051738 TaxID=3365672 RepID=UPI0037D102A7
MTTSPAPAIAIDVGTQFVRIAWTSTDGTPELVPLTGTVPGEGLPIPDDIRGDREAALSLAYTAYREHFGPPRQLVLVVRPQDRDAPPTDGGMPKPQLLDTPYAVLALLRHARTRIGSRLLVCDLGASAAEVAECVAAGWLVAVTRVARDAHAGGGYGGAFDAAVLDGAGLPHDDPDVLRDLGRAREENARRLEVTLDRMAARPDQADRLADTVVFEVAGREITAGLVYRALDRLTGGLDKALDGLPGVRTANPDQDPDRAAVIAVGGAARSGALLRHLTDRLGRPVPLPFGTDPALAAVFGAALVAGEHLKPADRYPHEVSVRVHRTVVGRPRDGEVLISPPGTLELGGATVFAQTGGERVRVRRGPGDGTGGRTVRILVRAAGTDAGATVGVVQVPPSGDGAYCHVGVRVAADGTAHLVLEQLGRSRPGVDQPDDLPPAAPPPREEFPFGFLPDDPRPDAHPSDPQSET